MMRIISAIMASIRQALQTGLDKLMGTGASLIALPFQVFGFGGGSPLPSYPPVFQAPVDTDDLFADLVSGRAPTAKVRDLDREGVNSVFKLARMTKDERAEANLSAVERDDVRALLLTMSFAELQYGCAICALSAEVPPPDRASRT